MSITILDIIIIVLFIIAAIGGYKKGIIKEIISFIGAIIIFIISYKLKGITGEFLCTILPFIVEDLVSINIILYQIIGFFLTFGILTFLFNMFLGLLKFFDDLLEKIKLLSIPLKIIGAVVSILQMYLFVFIMLIIVMIPFRNKDFVKNSMFTEKIVYNTPVLSEGSKKIINVLDEIIAIDKEISDKKITKNEGNLKIIELLLKTEMVDKEEIMDLYNNGRIKEIEELDNIFSNN